MHGRSMKWLLLAGLVAAGLLPALASADEHDLTRVRTFHQTNLVSDLASEGALVTDHCLVNPWGIAYTNGGSPFWVSDNNAGVATLYPVAGQTGVGVNARIVAILPTPSTSTCRSGSLASALGTPTGVVFNSSTSKTDSRQEGNHLGRCCLHLRHGRRNHRRLESYGGPKCSHHRS